MIATIESLLGSVWFALLLGVLGYIAGNAWPIRKIFK